jgi:hypothetical protein
VTIIFLESPEPDTQGFWRKQNSTTRGSVNLREIGEVYHVDMFCAGVSFICAYVLDTETNQSLTTIHRHFHTPTSLRPCHFDSHLHFSSPFLVLETQKLEPSRTKKNPPHQIFVRGWKFFRNGMYYITMLQLCIILLHLSPPLSHSLF